MTAAQDLPQFVRDLLASRPRRGQGLNRWFFCVARLLHAFRTRGEIVETLRATTAGEAVKPGEIERAVERSAACAWRLGEPVQQGLQPPWPKVNAEQREAVVASIGAGLVDLWETAPVRFEDNKPYSEEIIDTLFPGNPLLCCGESKVVFATRHAKSGVGS